jgi:hypothetical protein
MMIEREEAEARAANPKVSKAGIPSPGYNSPAVMSDILFVCLFISSCTAWFHSWMPWMQKLRMSLWL